MSRRWSTPSATMPVSAADVLLCMDATDKAHLARRFRAAVVVGEASPTPSIPARPQRPDRPELVPPHAVAKRRLGSVEGRAALLHAIAHIELNAIDLAADMIARFSDAPELDGARDTFVDDWSSVCDDEARHFLMIEARLHELGFRYGDFPAHDGLWEAALATKDDIAARLAVAPLVLEARGLDVTPGMIRKLDGAGDRASADVLRVIYREEVAHVACGVRWFHHVADSRGETRDIYFDQLVRAHFRGRVKPPFNVDARDRAQFPEHYYTQLAAEPPKLTAC